MRFPLSFFSIRYRIVLIATLALVSTGLFFVWQQYHMQLRQFDFDQALSRTRNQALVSRLLQVQDNRMQTLGQLLIGMPEVRANLLAGRSEPLERVVDGWWSELSLAQGIAALAIYDSTGHAFVTLGDPPALSGQRAQVNTVLRRELPVSELTCAETCYSQTLLPILYHGKTLGVLALSSSLESTILELRQLAGAEVVVLTGTQAEGASPMANMATLSASGGEATAATLAAARTGVWQEGYFQLARNGQTQQVMLLPVSGQVHLALVSDVSRQIDNIRAQVFHDLRWGSGVLLLAMLLLFVSLRRPMRRLEHLTALLPLLGDEKFAAVREQYATRPKSHIRDEIDDLEELTVTLSSRMETLLLDYDEHINMLVENMTQLESERDLVRGLLNTAPVLIVTYGADGRIQLANQCAVQVTGLAQRQVIDHSFPDVFLDHWQRGSYLAELSELKEGEIEHGESSVVSENGGVREIIWFHSRMHAPGATSSYLSIGMDITERREIELRLEELADHDAVSGTYNRRAFKRILDELLAQGQRGMILLCDLDQFKSINDIGGHEAGDAALAACAGYFRQLEPTPKLLARLGSDEFALVFPDLLSADAMILVRQISQALRHHGGLPQIVHGLSVCVGLAEFPQHGNDADTLIGNAQSALTHAMEKGIGSWQLYASDDPHREEIERHSHWHREVERALEDNRFELHFQPIQHIDSGEMSHYEALLRLVSHDGSLVAPGMFIEVAERTGLIRQIDAWVIDHVAAFVAAHPGVTVALNLSGRSFDDDAAMEAIKAALLRYQISGESLWLEITETAALDNFANAVRVMGELRQLGCRFGLDDFGVGYSSFQYLKELPVDFVKIDGSFITGLTQNADDRVFVRALNEAAQGFGKRTIAEFVETAPTLELLREIGVDMAQGYLIGRPAAETR